MTVLLGTALEDTEEETDEAGGTEEEVEVEEVDVV